MSLFFFFFFFQAEDGIRDRDVTGVQTCALPICWVSLPARGHHPCRPLVPAVRSVLPGRGGAPGRTRHRGRPREHLPVGPAVRPGVRRGGWGTSARGTSTRRT